jgi:hypothetical protein
MIDFIGIFAGVFFYYVSYLTEATESFFVSSWSRTLMQLLLLGKMAIDLDVLNMFAG